MPSGLVPAGLEPSVAVARSGHPSGGWAAATPDTSQLTVTVAMTITGDAALRAADEVSERLWHLAARMPSGASVVNVATTVASVHTEQTQPQPATGPPATDPAGGRAPLRMFPVARIVTLDDAPVRLTRREFDLLLHLSRHPGRVFTRQQLSLAVWQEDFMRGERTIDVHIHRLRLKLGGRGPVITTVRGIGYRLDAGHRVWVARES